MFALAGFCFRLIFAVGFLACRLGAALGTLVGQALVFALKLAWQTGKERPVATTRRAETPAEIAHASNAREQRARQPLEFTPRPLRPRARKRR